MASVERSNRVSPIRQLLSSRGQADVTEKTSSRGCKVDDRWLHQSLKVFVLHPNRFNMRAGVEHDLFVGRKRAINVNIHAVQISERRHRAKLATRKQRCEF